MKKATVVGGGITGIATALYLNKKNFDVTIYESSKNIGGILKDSLFDQDLYFSNCQYLNKNSKWMDLFFNETFKKDFFTFNHTYSSYTDIFGKAIATKEYAMPVSQKTINLANFQKSNEINNIIERFSYYGNDHKKALINFSKKYFENISNLHHSFVYPTQLSKIYFENINEIKKIKNDYEIANEILGLPRSKLSINQKLESIIPINGYNHFFNNVKKLLGKLNIKVFCNSPIRPALCNTNKQNPIDIFYKKEKIESDITVWCSNPTPLIKVCDIGILDNPFTRFKSYFLKTNNFQIDEPHYIQVFSKYTNITRIYLYPIQNKNMKITVEKIDDSKDFNHDLSIIEKILSKFNFNVKLIFNNQYTNQKRHILYTYQDLKKFEEMEEFVKEKNFICGAWTKYGRDDKINSIYNRIDQI